MKALDTSVCYRFTKILSFAAVAVVAFLAMSFAGESAQAGNPLLTNYRGFVQLNPQPLPPRWNYLNPQPLPPRWNYLNPQPLPPRWNPYQFNQFRLK